jgi:hypothetical protein
MNSIPILTKGSDVIIRLYCDMNMPIIGKVFCQSLDGVMVETEYYMWSVSINDIATIGQSKATPLESKQ